MKKMNRIRKISAFTLVEVLLAITIMAALMAATVRIMYVLRNSAAAIEKRDIYLKFDSRLKALLDMDMAHALSVEKADDGFAITSLASLDKQTMDLRHIPSAIAYEIITIDGRKWLIRSQLTNDSNVPLAELVCADVVNIDCRKFEGPERDDTSSITSEPETQPTQPASQTQPQTQPAESPPKLILGCDYVTVTIDFLDADRNSQQRIYNFFTYNESPS